MAFEVEPLNNGVSGGVKGRTRKYLVRGTGTDADSDEDACMQAVAGAVSGVAPQVISDAAGGFLTGNDVSVDSIYWTQSGTLAVISVAYGQPEDGSLLGGSNSSAVMDAQHEFSYQAPTAHIEYALSTTSYPRSGTTAPNFGNRIRVKYDGPDMVVEGIDLQAGTTTDSWTLTAPYGFIGPAYRDLVVSLMGQVNSQPFAGRPIGTMRFVQCSSTIQYRKSVRLQWGFQFSENRTGVVIGGITVANIGGHQIWWTLDDKQLDAAAKKIVLRERAVYVQTVYKTGNLNQLNFNPH